MTVQSRAAARRQIEDQRALAQRLLAEMENPTPLKPEVAAKAAAFNAEVTRNGWGADEQESHYAKPKGYLIADRSDIDEVDGHQLWTGYTYIEQTTGQPVPKQNGPHGFCGKSHFCAARAAKEEQLGYALDEYSDIVTRTCDEPLCVAPAHHEVEAR